MSPDKIVTGARHPRNNEAWPKVGIFAQRGKNRPNRIGSTICRLVGVKGRTLGVKALDAIAGTLALGNTGHPLSSAARPDRSPLSSSKGGP